jgi:hypothetical protein
MREDDGEIRYYVPVVRRLVVLAAVIVAVPMVMWTITSFVRTYLGPVRAPTIQAMSASPVAAAPDQTATIPMDAPAGTASAEAKIAPMPPPLPTNATVTIPAGSQSVPGQSVAMSSSAPPPPAATPAPVAATSSAMAMSSPATSTPGANPAPNPIWPAPPPAAGTTPLAPTASASPIAPVADALPPPEPLTGAVPLPRKRPHSFVVAQASIPTPRPRPAPGASSPVQNTAYTVTPAAGEAPASSPFDWLLHLFQPSSSHAASPTVASGPQEDLSGAH